MEFENKSGLITLIILIMASAVTLISQSIALISQSIVTTSLPYYMMILQYLQQLRNGHTQYFCWCLE